MRATCVALTLLGLAPAATGCAAPTSHAGIPLAPGSAEPLLQDLARRAASGDKQAQLELGIRYEEGRGLAVDLARAARLYRRAATASGGPIYIYVPPVGGGRGYVMPVDQGPRQAGLPAARARLADLRARAAGARP